MVLEALGGMTVEKMTNLERFISDALPIPATEFRNSTDLLGATQHSLHKWRMLRDEKLKVYGLKRVYGVIAPDKEYWSPCSVGEAYEPSGADCALCQISKTYKIKPLDCDICPFTKIHGYPCDDDTEGPWNIWCDEGDPGPMIKALEEVERKLKDSEGNKSNG